MVIPAGQATLACATLPSSNSACKVVSGTPGGWLGVGRDMLLRGALIYGGIFVYDLVTGHRDKHRAAHALAASAGIEAFVLGWTFAMTPRSAPVTGASGEP